MRFASLLALICTVLTLSACKGGQVKPQLSAQEKEKKVLIPVKVTKQSIPQQRYDQFGNKVPYVASLNPYLVKSGQIDKATLRLFTQAKNATRNRQYGTAKKKLVKITQTNGQLSGPWVFLGEIAKQEKKYDQAVEHYERAITINKNNVNAYTGLAHAYRLNGKFRMAQNTLAQALQVWPDFPEAHLNLGVLYDLYLNEPKLAQQHMEAYIFLSKRPKKEAKDWLAEVKSRTGIQTSFIDKGPGALPPVILPVESEKKDGENAAEAAIKGVTG